MQSWQMLEICPTTLSITYTQASKAQFEYEFSNILSITIEYNHK
jgi:hypothetical protein